MACCVFAARILYEVASLLGRLRTAVLGRSAPEKLNAAVAWGPDHTVVPHHTVQARGN